MTHTPEKTLWDEFAMAAMQGCLAYSYCCPVSGNWQLNSDPEDLAKKSYEYADAMINERNKVILSRAVENEDS